jgi:hypothetical protein
VPAHQIAKDLNFPVEGWPIRAAICQELFELAPRLC